MRPDAAVVIKRVLGSTCIYHALGLSKGADDALLHKQYKRSEVTRREMLQEVGNLVGRWRIIQILENY